MKDKRFFFSFNIIVKNFTAYHKVNKFSVKTERKGVNLQRTPPN